MAKAVGLSRAIKPEWANKTVQLVQENMAANNIKEALDEYLSYEIKDPTNISKARNILMNMWVNDLGETANKLRAYALSIYADCDDKTPLHWCMLLLAYPVFVEWTGLLGKISVMQDSFTGAWLKNKIFEELGERTTLLYATEKLLQTVKQFGVVNSEGRGMFSFKKLEVKDNKEIKLIIKTVLALKLKAYYEPSELTGVAQMFPFEYGIDSELIFGAGEFELGNFGGSPVVVG